MNALAHELRLVFVALQFLTRIPAPAWVGYDPEWLHRSVRHFPLIGALVGVVGAAVAWAALQAWPPAIAALLATATTLWLTAAFHEDGLADTFDALLGAASRDKALAIMKDSRIGTYGAAALVLSLGLRVLLFAELLARNPVLALLVLVASHAAGRSLAVVLMATLPYAGDEAHAKAKPLARDVRAIDAAWAAFTGLLLLAVAAWAAPLRLATAATALVALVLLMRAWFARRLGGYTGDTLGATEQFGEMLVLLAFTAAIG